MQCETIFDNSVSNVAELRINRAHFQSRNVKDINLSQTQLIEIKFCNVECKILFILTLCRDKMYRLQPYSIMVPIRPSISVY